MNGAAPGPGWWARHGLRIGISLCIAAAFGWLLHAGALPLTPDGAALGRVRWWTVPAYLCLWSLVHVVRSARWALLLAPLHPVPLGRVIAVAFIGFAAIVALPLRMGEAVRPVLIRRRGHLSAWAATGTVGAERVSDGLFLSLLLFAALGLSQPLDPLPDRIGSLAVPASVVPAAAYGALVVFALAFTAMGLFYWRRAWAVQLTERVVGLVSKPLAGWLAERVGHVADGLTFLSQARVSVPFLAATAVYWLANGLGTWLLAWGVGFDGMTFSRACAVMGVLALGILVPNAPGFFGAYQLSLYAGLALYFQPEQVTSAGSVFVFLSYVCQLGITFAAAALGFMLERGSLAEAIGATDDAEEEQDAGSESG